MHIPDAVRRMPAQHPCLEPALEATVRAAGELMERFGKSMDVESKGTANFVSEADKAAEYAILKTLRRSYPDHGYLAEESQTSIVSTSEHLWIIDPLDGTSNYLHGIPHFAISIAYYRNREPELAIVHNPVTQDWYVAARGQGAWTTQGRQRVCDATRLNEVLIACGFYYDRGAMMRATLDTIAAFFECDIHGMRRFGAAALDLCNLGSGQYGVFFEYQLHPWDFAAGQLFVQEAGGVCTDCDGKALPLDGPSSICATNKSLHQVALAKIAPHWRGLQR